MKNLHTSFILRSILSLCIFLAWGNLYALAATVCYTFTSSKWEATSNNVSANWISIQNGSTDFSPKNIWLVKSGTACGNSPVIFSNIESVTVYYTTNKSSGKGTISVYCVNASNSAAKSGNQIGQTYSDVNPGNDGAVVKTIKFCPSSSCSGYVQIYATCSENSIHIQSVDIEYSSTNPDLVASINSVDFGTLTNGSSVDKTFTLSGSNLNGDATLSVEGNDFTVSPTSVAVVDGKITDANVTVSYYPNSSGNHSSTLTIASDGASNLTIPLTGKSVDMYSVTWMVNGEVYTTGNPTSAVEQNTKISTLPTSPADINNKTFMGWTNEEISSSTDEQPSLLFTSASDAPAVTGDVVYYAVFATQKGNMVTYNKLSNNSFNTNATYVLGAEDANGQTYYFYKVNTQKTWGLMTSDTSAQKPMLFTLSGTAKKIVAVNEANNYLCAVKNEFSLSSEVKYILISDDGSIHDTNKIYALRYNPNTQNYGLRWYPNGDGSSFNFAYFYEVCGGYSYCGYCTTVSTDPVSGTLAFKAHDADGTLYATFSAQQDVVFTNDVNVYGVNVKDEKVMLRPLAKSNYSVTDDAIGTIADGQYVPANIGVLLKSRLANVTYYFPEESLSVTLSNNLLKPALAEGGVFTAEDGYVYYKLAYSDYDNQTGLGFYWGADNGGAFTVKAGTAYLAVPAAQSTSEENAKGFALDGVTDNIGNDHMASPRDGQIYNLCGQLVSDMSKAGLYIVNGKKIVVGK